MTPTQREAAERLVEFEHLPRKLLDIACRARVNECLFHDDEFVDDASRALKDALDLLRELLAEPQGKPVAEVVDCSEIDIDGNLLALRELDWCTAALDRLPSGTKLYAHPPQQRKPSIEPFVVRHYAFDERPSIKGNGFDGLAIGEDREEAECFIAFVNAAITGEPTIAQDS